MAIGMSGAIQGSLAGARWMYRKLVCAQGLAAVAASVELDILANRHLLPLRGVCIQCSRCAGRIHEGGVGALALHRGSYFRLLHDFCSASASRVATGAGSRLVLPRQTTHSALASIPASASVGTSGRAVCAGRWSRPARAAACLDLANGRWQVVKHHVHLAIDTQMAAAAPR